MSIVRAKCTNCNQIVSVDDAYEAATCPFCNQPFNTAAAIRNLTSPPAPVAQPFPSEATPSEESSDKESTLVSNARYYLNSKDYDRAIDCANRALALNPNNSEAKAIVSQLMTVSGPNITITRGSSFSGSLVNMLVMLDGMPIGNISNGSCMFYTAQPGQHFISARLGMLNGGPIPFTLPTGNHVANIMISVDEGAFVNALRIIPFVMPRR